MRAPFSAKRIALLAVLAAAFAALSYAIMTGKTVSFDLAVQSSFFLLRHPVLTKILVPISYSGNWPFVSAVILVLLIIPKTRFAYGLPLMITALTSVAFYQGLKHAFMRPRPDVSLHLLKQGGYSFPSGHGQTSLVVWMTLAMLLIYYCRHRGESLGIYKKHPRPAQAYIKTPKNVGIACGLLLLYALIIAMSRVYVGVHWPTDIIGGHLVGLFILVLANYLFFGFCDKIKCHGEN